MSRESDAYRRRHNHRFKPTSPTEPESPTAEMEARLRDVEQQKATYRMAEHLGDKLRELLRSSESERGNRMAVPLMLSPLSASLLVELTRATGLNRGRLIDEMLITAAEDLAGFKKEREERNRELFGDGPQIGTDEWIDDVMMGRPEK